MINKLLKISFYIALAQLIFILGFISYKYKIKIIFEPFNYVLQFTQDIFQINLEKFGDRTMRRIDKLSDKEIDKNTNFNIYNKPKNDFEYFLFLKNDFSDPVLLSGPDNVVWKWNLENFRNSETMVPYHLYPNGDIIIGKPETTGIFRVDKYGKIKWRIDKKNHHWIGLHKNLLFIPSLKYVNLPKDISKNNAMNTGMEECKYSESRFDSILVIDSDRGKIMQEIDLVPILFKDETFKEIYKSKLEKDKLISNEEPIKYLCKNPLHLNDIVYVDESIKKNLMKTGVDSALGNLILSFRSLDSIIMFNPNNNKIGFIITDFFEAQHSPRISESGHLLVFDNQWQHENKNKSRIVKVDIKENKIEDYYYGKNKNFYSPVKGRINLKDGRLFIQSSMQGEIFEIVCENDFFNNCSDNYLYSAVYSYTYPGNIYTKDGKFKKDNIFIGDFYDREEINFLK